MLGINLLKKLPQSLANLSECCTYDRFKNSFFGESELLWEQGQHQISSRQGQNTAYPHEEGLHHTVGLLEFRLPSIRVDSCLDYLNKIIAELQLDEKNKMHLKACLTTLRSCRLLQHFQWAAPWPSHAGVKWVASSSLTGGQQPCKKWQQDCGLSVPRHDIFYLGFNFLFTPAEVLKVKVADCAKTYHRRVASLVHLPFHAF